MTKFLSEVPLQPKHRLVSIRMAINANFEYRNYGVVARLVRLLLLRRNLQDVEEMREKLRVCEDNSFTDHSLPQTTCPLCSTVSSAGSQECTNKQCARKILFCFATFRLLTQTSCLYCSYCNAIFTAEEDGPLKEGDQCNYCSLAKIAVLSS